MAKGAYLTPQVKNMVAEIYRRRPGSGPTKVREELLKRMKDNGLDKIFGNDWPSVATVSKLLAEYRQRDEERTPESKELQKSWSIGSLAKYPIPPEALPLVISSYEKCLLEAVSDEWKLSIREALWIGRLYNILEIYHSRHIIPSPNAKEEALLLETGYRPKGYQSIKLEDLILDWAYAYASWEELREVEGDLLFDSDELDGHLMHSIFSYYGERRRDFIDDMTEKYDIDDKKYRELQTMPMEEIQTFFQQLSEKGDKNER